MAQQQSNAFAETWKQWEGRVVNGRYPLGRYVVGGEHCAVYLTSSNGSRAVIKLVHAHSDDGQTQLMRWELAARLSHPHLIRIFDTGRWHADDEQELTFAVMECADENLSESRRALTSAEARQMLEPTLDALRYLHSQGLVHNRLRPANVMAVGEVLKLSSDSVRRMGKTESPTEAADAYEGPEKVRGVIAPSGDIWSLGVLLKRALTNRLSEYDGKSDTSVSSLPSPFDDIVKHCVKEDPERRWSAAEIRKRLDRPGPEATATPIDVLNTPATALRSVEKSRHAKSSPSPEAPRLFPNVSTLPPAILQTVGDRWRLILAVSLVVLALFAIIVGLRGGKSPSRAAEPTMATSTQSAVPAGMPPAALGSAAKPPMKGAEASVRHQVLPEILQRARNSISGTVKVKVKVAVDASGTVSRETLVARGPSPYFATQALQAARLWTFDPPQGHGQPTGSEWALTFEFRKSGTKAKAQRIS